MQNRPRVVVTGVGVVSSCGTGTSNFWNGLNAPFSTSSDVMRADECDTSLLLSHKELRRLDRFTQLALVAADEALRDAFPTEEWPNRSQVGVVVGTGIGGVGAMENETVNFLNRGDRGVSPILAPMTMPNAAAAAISMRWLFTGPCEAVASACATGNSCLGRAAELIQSGRCDVVVTGSAESCLNDVARVSFRNLGVTSKSGRLRPFDRDRDGLVMAEGSAIVVLESDEHARRRGARVHAEILGWASTADAHHVTAPATDGRGAMSCIERTLRHAGLTPGDITHISAHGTGTSLNDSIEATVIRQIFGRHQPVVSAPKGRVGHTLGAAASIDAVALILCMRHGSIPPTAGYEIADPNIDLDIVSSEPRSWQPAPTLSNAFGFGGHNACVVFGPPTSSTSDS